MPRPHALAGVVLAVLAAPTPAVAQQVTETGPGFADTLVASWTELTTRCVPMAFSPFPAPPIARSDCRLRGITALGSVGGLEWSIVRYLRQVVAADSAGADTIPLDELVLLARAPGADNGQVAWRVVRERTYEFLDTLLWTPTPRGPFLEVAICLNGTGGCYTEYLRFVADAWRAVAQPFARDLQAGLPPDHSLHKGRRLDLVTLAGAWPVLAPGDPNCCPSLEIPFRLRLDGDTLRLVGAGPLRRAREP